MNTRETSMPMSSKRAYLDIHAALSAEVESLLEARNYDEAILTVAKMKKIEDNLGITEVSPGHFVSGMSVDLRQQGRIESAAVKPGAVKRSGDDPSASERH